MNSSNLTYKNVDAYIKAQPKDIIPRLVAIHEIMKKHATEAVESILYGMPAFKTFGKPLIYFAAFPKHIWFYTTPTWHKTFAKELAWYKQWKWSVQFPHDQPLPLALITKIVKFRVKENKEKYGAKK